MAKEYIERKALLQDIDETVIVSGKTGATNQELRGINKVIVRIQAMPTADVVEVVRCKDCKWINKTKMICICPNNRVFNTGKTVYSNNFCNYGAKMDKE